MELVINDFISKRFAYPIPAKFEWFTEVVTLDTNREQRNQTSAQPRRHWAVNWSLLNEAEIAELIEFYNRAGGRYRTFRFRDPLDEDGSFSTTQAAIAIDTAVAATKVFTVVADIALTFTDGVEFQVTGSGDNNGDYTCDGDATSDGTTTTITVVEAVVNAAADTGSIMRKDFQLAHAYYSGETETWTEEKKRLQNFTIIAVSTADETFTIAGRHVGQFEVGTKFGVFGSTGNDANWEVDSVAHDGTNTVITVTGNITDATVDGTIKIIYVEVAAGAKVPTTDYTIDADTGIIRFVDTKAPTDAQTITAVFKFDFVIRFNEDIMTYNWYSAGWWTSDNLELIEVKL